MSPRLSRFHEAARLQDDLARASIGATVGHHAGGASSGGPADRGSDLNAAVARGVASTGSFTMRTGSSCRASRCVRSVAAKPMEMLHTRTAHEVSPVPERGKGASNAALGPGPLDKVLFLTR